jgi:hypothetical protein
MRTPATPAAIAVILAAGASACAWPQEQPEPWPFAGCHYFRQDDVARELHLPWGVRLLDRPLEGWPAIARRDGVRRATTLTGRDERDFPFGYWIRTANDSLEIGYPGGGGLVLELAAEDNAFSGTARPVGDALPPPAVTPPTRRYPVHLTRARCPEED